MLSLENDVPEAQAASGANILLFSKDFRTLLNQ